MSKKLLGVAVALFAGAAFAQSGNTGNITLRGTVARTVSISNATAQYVAPGSGPAAVFNAATTPTAFDIDWDFGDINLLTPTVADPDSTVKVVLSFEMRSNDGYVLTAQAFDITGGTTVLAPSEVGFCTSALGTSANTARVLLPRADVPAYDCRTVPNNSYDATTDVVTYASTLANIIDADVDPTTATSVLTGNQISTGGSNNSVNNYITVGTEFSFRPQLFLTQGAFNYMVTFTASNP